MRRFVIILPLIIILMFPMTARAETAEVYDYGRQALEEAVPPEAADILENEGITPDNGGAAKLTFSGVMRQLTELVREQMRSPLQLLMALCGIVLLCALSANISDCAQDRLSGLFNTVGVLAGAGLAVAAISDVINRTLDLLSSAALFITAFIPIFAGILAVMGKTATASAINAVTLAATQLFSQLAVNFLAPLCGAVMGLSIAGAVHPQLNLSNLGELIKKVVVWTLCLIMTVFMSILSVQTFVTNSADSMLIRTAKFAVSSGVPIVGGTISDAVATVHGSLGVIRSAVGTYGIIAAAVIILPTLINVACYRAAIACAQAASDIFGIKELSALLKSCGAVMAIITAVIACFLLLNTIAAVIMLLMGGGSA